MSEYQYYEFTTLDRTLTAAQRAELRACSTRAEITATSFTSEYNWGDLRADPMDWMERHFDAHVYLSNWGVCNFMVSLPHHALVQYLDKARDTGAAFSIMAAKSRCIVIWTLDLDSASDERFHEDGGGGWMERLQPLREELMRGDLRSLYLGWMALMCAEELDHDALEPPVPPGLRQLTPAQAALAEFLLIDPDLLSVAAAASADLEDEQDEAEEDALADWLEQLPVAELRDSARMLLNGAGREAERTLRNRFLMWKMYRSGLSRAASDTRPPPRTVAQIEAGREAAALIRQEQERHAREAREKRQRAERGKQLAAVVARADAIWKELDALLELGTGSSYGAADTAIRELAEAMTAIGRRQDFQRGLSRQLARHGKRPAWLKRLAKAGLM